MQLAIRRWAAWAPGLDRPEVWREWASGARSIEATGKPDLRFVDPILRRRLSFLSGMSVRVATDCLTDALTPDHFVFCSQFGEYTRSFELLQALARDEPLSPMGFSVSVHNTASSYFSIMRNNMSPSVSVAGGCATLEAAFIEAGALVQSGDARSVLLVYAGEPMPKLYRNLENPVRQSASIGFLLSAVGDAAADLTLDLAWHPNPVPLPDASSDPALEVLRLIASGSGSFVHGDGRLGWTWNVRASQD